MEKYNYLEQVTTDAKEAILENMEYWDFDDREELEEVAHDELWADDSVTGNGSSSYFCSTWRAEEALVNYSGDNEEFNAIWDALYKMACCDFIDSNTWQKFFDQCRGWYVDEENACVRDELNTPEGVDSIVWKYDGNAEYKA